MMKRDVDRRPRRRAPRPPAARPAGGPTGPGRPAAGRWKPRLAQLARGASCCPTVSRQRAHSYTCRYLRTNRIEKAFRISVITNSSIPTANTVLYWTLPVARSPLATDAM